MLSIVCLAGRMSLFKKEYIKTKLLKVLRIVLHAKQFTMCSLCNFTDWCSASRLHGRLRWQQQLTHRSPASDAHPQRSARSQQQGSSPAGLPATLPERLQTHLLKQSRSSVMSEQSQRKTDSAHAQMWQENLMTGSMHSVMGLVQSLRAGRLSVTQSVNLRQSVYSVGVTGMQCPLMTCRGTKDQMMVQGAALLTNGKTFRSECCMLLVLIVVSGSSHCMACPACWHWPCVT